ncbi:hypothetical protein [Undibacterium sp. Ji22W]|uniref:hypothetical protein n=1 Tax=Undibacterium sp. Ji22W TaxID=3413038 RepID=UPI003BF20C63
MKPSILLINLPQTALGQRLPECHLPSQRLWQIHARLSVAGHSVEVVDADFYTMNLFNIVRAIRWHAPQTVWVVEQNDSAMSKLLHTLLQATMPHLRWRTVIDNIG